MTGARGTGVRLSYRDYKLNLLAGVPQTIDVTGNYWQVIEALGPVKLSFDESAAITRVSGTGGPAEYTRVTVRSDIDQAVTITLGQTLGMVPYDRGTMTFSGTVNVAPSVPTVNASLPDAVVPATSLVMLVGVDATRRALLIKLPSSSAGPIRVGDSAIGATQGLLIEEGETANIDGTPAVYVYNPNAVDVTVTLLNQRLP